MSKKIQKKPWSKLEDEILKNIIINGRVPKEIPISLERTRRACVHRLKELRKSNLEEIGQAGGRTYSYWSQEDDKLFTALVDQATPLIEISKLINKSYNACSCRLRTLKLKNKFSGFKKYSQNDNFWNIPNPINCYYSGILTADGNIMIKNKKFEYMGCIRWELNPKDICLLENFKEVTEYSGPIYFYERKGISYPKLVIYSQSWNKDLVEKFNLIPNKTFRTMPPPNISDQLMFCWIVGLIDGDGTIGCNKDAWKASIRIYSCSKELIHFIYNFLKERFPKAIAKNRDVAAPRKCADQKNCWEIGVYGVRALCLYDYLRQYNLPKLARKWDKPEMIQAVEEYKIKYPHLFDFSYLPEPVK